MSDVLRIEAETITTRRRARQLAIEAVDRDLRGLDLGNAEFVSRPVADELVHQADEHALDRRGADGPVASMIEVIDGAEVA